MTPGHRIDNEYVAYLNVEWELFKQDPARAQASLAASAQIEVSRVLDLGCGAGQELWPFVQRGAFGVGTDLAPDAGLLGQELFAHEGLAGRVAFLRSTAEHLPFRPAAFDVLVCRLALPYTDNRLALQEMARVLRPGGILLLKIHHAWFYVDKLRRGLLSGSVPPMIHASRVLTAGVLYHLCGRQVRNWLVTNETFQSRWMLERELARHNLAIVREMPDSNPRTPSFVIRRTQPGA